MVIPGHRGELEPINTALGIIWLDGRLTLGKIRCSWVPGSRQCRAPEWPR